MRFQIIVAGRRFCSAFSFSVARAAICRDGGFRMQELEDNWAWAFGTLRKLCAFAGLEEGICDFGGGCGVFESTSVKFSLRNELFAWNLG